MKGQRLYQVIQLVIIVMGISIGMFFSQKSQETHASTHASYPNHMLMDHGVIDVGNDQKVPEIEQLTITKDSMSGWNLYISTKNFEFTPSKVGSTHIAGQGHAHLYINGKKAARIYSNWFHLPKLEYEINELEITLNSNAHTTMTLNSSSISLKLIDFEQTYSATDFITLCNQ